MPAPGLALRQHQQERTDLLPRGFAAQQQHLVLGRRQLVRRHGEKPALHLGEFVEKRFHLAAGESTERCLGHRFRRIGVALVHGQTEEVAGNQEARDLAPPIGKQLVELDRAGGHIEQGVRPLAFRENRLVRFDPLHLNDVGEPAQFIRLQCRTDRQGAYGAGAAGCGFSQGTLFAYSAHVEWRHGNPPCLLLLIFHSGDKLDFSQDCNMRASCRTISRHFPSSGRGGVTLPPRGGMIASSSSNRMRWAAPSRSSN